MLFSYRTLTKASPTPPPPNGACILLQGPACLGWSPSLSLALWLHTNTVLVGICFFISKIQTRTVRIGMCSGLDQLMLRLGPGALEIFITFVIIVIVSAITFQADQHYWPLSKHRLVTDLFCSHCFLRSACLPHLRTIDFMANIYWWCWWNKSSLSSQSHSLPYCSWSLPFYYTTCNSYIFHPVCLVSEFVYTCLLPY